VTTTLGEQIAAKEAELAQARETMKANYDRYAGTSSMRGKQHGIRVDAQIRRGAQLGRTVVRLELELTALRARAGQEQSPSLDLSKLSEARFIRTRYGWYEVVRVNRATVKVKAAPGMDDLVKVSKILEIR
jgi:hypothetical protein